MARERTYRGISERAALGYLERLGGERHDDRTVAAEDWRATVSSNTVTVGPTLSLTELTVRFEGDPETLDALIERFSQKAMRAGG